MKIKTKLFPCLGAMMLLTTILSGSAMAATSDYRTDKFTKDPSSFRSMKYSFKEEAEAWCRRGMENNDASCCSTAGNDLGHPGLISKVPSAWGEGYVEYCDLFGKYDVAGREVK